MKTINLKKIVLPIASLALLFSSACTMLDRPPLTTEDDETFWTSEDKVKSYAYGFYPRFFVGYNSGWGVTNTPLNYTLTDNNLNDGSQVNFERSVPTSRGSNEISFTTNPWMDAYDGPNWHFGFIRRANIMNDRVTGKMANILTAEQIAHWSGIARFFRAMNYAQLVQTFGDVPYYDTEVASDNFDEMYKPRTPRNEVMDHVYDDFKFAMENVKTGSDKLTLDKYSVAAFVARYALYEGTWQKYYYKNSERAQKFLQLAIDAAEVVMSGSYDITMEFRDQFTSTDLNKPDVVFWRSYGTEVKHCIASLYNFQSSVYHCPNLDLIKSFILSNGQDWQQAGDNDFTMEHLVASRDPRFEGSFYHKVSQKALSSYVYITKFIPREVADMQGVGLPAEYLSNVNITGYPVMRYAEVLLNWIEAKAELDESSVDQEDINASINKIRNRPVAAAAAAMGVVKTAPMQLAALPDDPARDADVSALLWEIRRERRMEFVMESSRLLDLKRWKKLDYMDESQNPDLLLGTWVDGNELAVINSNGEKEYPFRSGISKVTTASGETIVYINDEEAGVNNGDQMVGFYSTTIAIPRQPFLDEPGVNPYLAPIGIDQQRDYQNKGYQLAQTEGWPTGL
jgi:hypothetical protein